LRVISQQRITQRGEPERTQGARNLIPVRQDVGFDRIEVTVNAIRHRFCDRLGDRAGRLVVTDRSQWHVARREAAHCSGDIGHRRDLAHPHGTCSGEHPLPFQAPPDPGLDRRALPGGKNFVWY